MPIWVVILVAAVLGACDKADPCDPGQIFTLGICRAAPVDAAAQDAAADLPPHDGGALSDGGAPADQRGDGQPDGGAEGP